ncbi:MAG: aldehyde dehydrogenase family protein [Bradymonadaceae bacterium]
MTDQIANFIDGEWTAPSTGEWRENVNPADTREVINEFAWSDSSDLDRAVEAAVAAQPEWVDRPAPERGSILFEAHRLMRERTDELARALTREEGKILPEAKGEVQKTLNVLEFIAGEGRRLNGETAPSEIDENFVYTTRTPIGVAGLITPWNFPIAIPVWKIAPALVAGNSVVMKPAEQTPTTAKLVTEIFEEAGVPKGVLNVVFGEGETVGARLARHPDIDGLSFTGSTDVGLNLYETGASDNKKVQCEMGGKNAQMVLDDADLDLAVAAASKGAFGSTGQRCTATSRAVVHEDLHDEFVERLVQDAKNVQPGNGLDEETTMGPSVDADQLEQVLHYMQVAEEEGATVEVGTGRLTEGELGHGLFPAPTVLTDVDPDDTVAQEEIFGPVLSVIEVGSFEEALEVTNNSSYGLTSAIYTRDVSRVFDYVDEAETGILHVNNPTIGGEGHLPFGGIKNTGVGEREQGKTAVDFYTETKTVYIDYSDDIRGGNLF